DPKRLKELEKAAESAQHPLLQLSKNLLCGKLNFDSRDLERAEACYRANLAAISALPAKAPAELSATLLQLAELDVLSAKIAEAAETYDGALRAIEDNDAYIAASGLRMSFENQRRNAYERVIAFTNDHGRREETWRYLQNYSSKLFLEFLKKQSPAVTL